MKINDFRGELTDISAKKEPLDVQTVHVWLVNIVTVYNAVR